MCMLGASRGTPTSKSHASRDCWQNVAGTMRVRTQEVLQRALQVSMDRAARELAGALFYVARRGCRTRLVSSDACPHAAHPPMGFGSGKPRDFLRTRLQLHTMATLRQRMP